MIATLLILMILGSGNPWYKNAISTLAWGRLSSITLIFSSFLILNTFYTSRINTGISLFSGFFKVSLINQSIEIIMLIIAALILIPIINIKENRIGFVSQKSIGIKQVFNIENNWLHNYFLIILFNILGACCLMNSNDLLSLYVTIELQSFSLYILSTLNKDSINSASAGLKYFLIGSLASAFILLGIAFIYLLTGLTNFESLYVFLNITDFISSSLFMPNFWTYNMWDFDYFSSLLTGISQSSLIILAFLFILIGTFIKIGAAPFHQWTPDVYDQVPTKVTIWLVIIPKLSIFILILGLLDMIMDTANAANLTALATMVSDSLVKAGNLVNYHEPNIWNYKNNYYYLFTEYTNLLLMSVLSKFGHANFFNVYPDYASHLAWVNYYRTELPQWYYDYSYFNQGNYLSAYHNSIFLTYFIPTIQEVLIKNVLIFISIISLIIGSIAGLYQIKIKRLLAFSAINHVGFLILALAINTKTGLESFIFYIIQYSITNLNLFLILIAFGYLSYNSLNNNISLTIFNNHSDTNITELAKANAINGINKIQEKNHKINSYFVDKVTTALPKITDLNFISQLTGLFNSNSVLTMSFAITLFSFAGVPPLLGFYGKMQVLYTAISVGFIFVSIIAINMSVISAYYYLKLIQVSNFINANMYSNTDLENNLNKDKSILNNSFSKFISNSYFTGKVFQQDDNGNLEGKNIINNLHSYLISIITLIILLFTIKTDLLFNLTNILTSYSYNI